MATKYDVIKSPPDSSGIAEGIWEIVSRYADPDYQRQIKADKENQRRYELAREDSLRQESKLDDRFKQQRDELKRNQKYQYQLGKWNTAKAEFDEMFGMIGDDPRDIDKFLNQWPGINTEYIITAPDGSVSTETLSARADVLRGMNNDNLDNFNTYDSLKESWSGLPREERLAHYSEFEQAALDANKVLAPSIVEQNKRDLSYSDNEDVLNLLLSDDFLPVEMKTRGPDGITPAQKIKNLLLKDDKITDADLSMLNAYIARQFADTESYKKFMEKLHIKSLDALGSLKMDSAPPAAAAIHQLYLKSGKYLGLLDDSKPQTDQTSTIDLGSLTPHQQNLLNNTIINKAGGDEAYKNLSDEEVDKLTREVYASMFPPITEGTSPKAKESWRERIERIASPDPMERSRKYLYRVLYNEDQLRTNKTKTGFKENPIKSQQKNAKILKDPLSGKLVDRNTLLKNMQNTPRKYAFKGYIYDPTAVMGYISDDGEKKTFLIGYRKMSPKEALQIVAKRYGLNK